VDSALDQELTMVQDLDRKSGLQLPQELVPDQKLFLAFLQEEVPEPAAV
jgi:hypothetical protein